MRPTEMTDRPAGTVSDGPPGPMSDGYSPSGAGRPSPEDARDVTDLINAYAYHVDRLEPELVAAVFTEDCVVDYGGDDVLHGRRELAAHLDSRLSRFTATFHQTSNIRLQRSGDDILAVTYVHAWHQLAGENPEPEFIVRARYHDRVVRRDGSWLISERSLHVVAHNGVARTWRGASRRTGPDDPMTLIAGEPVITRRTAL